QDREILRVPGEDSLRVAEQQPFGAQVTTEREEAVLCEVNRRKHQSIVQPEYRHEISVADTVGPCFGCSPSSHYVRVRASSSGSPTTSRPRSLTRTCAGSRPTGSSSTMPPRGVPRSSGSSRAPTDARICCANKR